jgi:catechol 2,3-dioxygenase-like lactoylglutathione lyase family enzyme
VTVAVQLNHHIVHASDPEASARFLADVLGLDPPRRYGPFFAVETANGVGLDFMAAEGTIVANHYAFLVTEDEFDQIFGRVQERGLPYYADPAGRQPGEVNHHDGGRGVYWPDPDGHWLEIITRPYGSGDGTA